MSNVKNHIEEMTAAIFNIRRDSGYGDAAKEVSASSAKHSQQGTYRSGAFIRDVLRIYESTVTRTVEQTLEELALQFRQAGRRDPTLFWNVVEPKIQDLATSFSKSACATAAEKVRGVNPPADIVQQSGSQASMHLKQLIRSRVNELRLRSQFITLKTPDDRRANGVPDVAVMMWFPDPNTDSEDVVAAAAQRYAAIKEAVAESSRGLATVNKFDDPGVVSQDRISASIEVWLEKAVVVICDLAGQRHNVYYEFGYTRAIGTDVVLTCPKTDASTTKLHLGHWQRHEYSDLGELKQGLTEKLKALLPKYDLSGSL